MMETQGCQYVTACHDTESGLKAFIAIQNTSLGPALGGCRMWKYDDQEEALRDALSLAHDMSLRASISGCDLSGGAIVIMGSSKNGKSEELFRALGRFIHALEGRLIAIAELGTESENIADILRETPYAVNLPAICNESGEEALSAAWGVYYGIMTCAREVFKVTSLKDLSVVVQGVGVIGSSLIELMKRKDPQVQLFVSDIDYDKMKKVQDKYPEVKILSPEESITKECHIFVPCARGRIFSPDMVSQLRCKVIAGAARCQITADEVADRIHERGILMAPDFVINAGGVIHAENEIRGRERVITDESFRKVALHLARIFATAREEGRSPYRVAMEAAQKRLQRVACISRILAL